VVGSALRPIITEAADRFPAGSIHLFFEGTNQSDTVMPGAMALMEEAGYFAYNHTRMAGMNDFFGQCWKEYSLSDSRYLTSDPFVLCMETITAVRAPGPCEPTVAVPDARAIGPLGPAFLHRGRVGCLQTPPAPPFSSPRFSGPAIRRHFILHDEHVRPLLQGPELLPAGGILFLDVLLLYEFNMDYHPELQVFALTTVPLPTTR
jgi:hypothetical protein